LNIQPFKGIINLIKERFKEKKMTDKFAEVTTKREVIYEGAIIDVVVDDVLLPNGETSKRELVFHNSNY
jgi:hypothetical protein